MARAPQQADSIAILKTPFGTDVLNAVRFDGGEGLSELFEYTIEAVGEKTPIDFNSGIGQNCTLTVKGKTATRHYCGVLVEANHLEASLSYNTYRLTLRPWLWLLDHTSDCRIFHDKTVPEIIQEVFDKHGFQDYQFKLSENYQPREYTVQYRESDREFVCRLMEDEGIYYFFEHEDGKHTLILADAYSSHETVPGLDSLKYLQRMISGRSDVESVHEMITNRAFRSGKFVYNDYDYEKPSQSMKTEHTQPSGYARDDLELYDYPGRYKETDDGTRYTKVRLEGLQAADHRRQAIGDAPAAVPGGLIRLEEHPVGSENIEYLIVRCSHSFRRQDYRSGGGGQGDSYEGSYELQDSSRPYRAPMATPRPRVLGPQTAKVVGAQGEEIDVDEMGRILVRFHWDREEGQSRRVRVSQSWSGPQWGTIHIPRIGQEVVVEFLEGNPDRPLVVGTVYNAEREVPYELPANKTKAGWKSNSSKGGSGYNELVFEDRKNSEEIGIHAQKDLNIVVLDTETREIGEKFTGGGASRKTTLKKGDDDLDIEMGNQTVDIAQSQTVTAGNSITLEANTKITLKVGGSKIELTPAGITITGTAKIDLNGGAMLTAKAGIIKLN